MANTITDFLPDLYLAADVVSRELTGFIPAVSLNAEGATAAVGEEIRIPITQENEIEDVAAADFAPDGGDQWVDSTTVTISKSKMAPIRWNGEETVAVGNTGQFHAILRDQMAQAMRVLVKQIEADIAATYIAASRAYGTPGTTPFASGLGDMAQIRKILVDNGAPTTDLHLVCDGLAAINLRNNENLIHADQAGTDETLRNGSLLNVFGLAIHESSLVARHIPGTVTGSMAVNHAGGYVKGDASIAWDGATAASLKAGDVLTFGTASDKYLVSEASTATPLTIAKPGLVRPVPNDAAVSLAGAYTANMAFARSAICLVMRDPAMPPGGDKAALIEHIQDPVTGLRFQVAVYRLYRRIKFEIGAAWGVKLIKPEHCAILLG